MKKEVEVSLTLQSFGHCSSSLLLSLSASAFLSIFCVMEGGSGRLFITIIADLQTYSLVRSTSLLPLQLKLLLSRVLTIRVIFSMEITANVIHCSSLLSPSKYDVKLKKSKWWKFKILYQCDFFSFQCESFKLPNILRGTPAETADENLETAKFSGMERGVRGSIFPLVPYLEFAYPDCISRFLHKERTQTDND